MKRLLSLLLFLGLFSSLAVNAELLNTDPQNAPRPGSKFQLDIGMKNPNHDYYDCIIRFKLDASEREYRIYKFKYFPPKGGFRKGEKYPTIIYLHGNNILHNYYANNAEPLFTLAPRNGYAVIMPEAQDVVWTNGRVDRARNGGDYVQSVAYNHDYDNDDMYLFKGLLESSYFNKNIDLKHVYIVGTSSGGMMALKFGYLADHMIKGVRIAGMGIMGGSVEHRFVIGYRPRPIPYIHFHGVKDKSVAWNKEDGGLFSNRPAKYSIAFWREINHADKLAVDEEGWLPYKDWHYKHQVFVDSVKGEDSAPVEYYLFDELAHDIRGKDDLLRTYYYKMFDFFKRTDKNKNNK